MCLNIRLTASQIPLKTNLRQIISDKIGAKFNIRNVRGCLLTSPKRELRFKSITGFIDYLEFI